MNTFGAGGGSAAGRVLAVADAEVHGKVMVHETSRNLLKHVDIFPPPHSLPLPPPPRCVPVRSAQTSSTAMFRVRVFLQKFLILLHVTISTIIGKTLMILFPKAMKRYILKLGEKSRMNEYPKFKYENWGPTFFSFKYLLFVLKVKWKRLEDEAYEGHPAPNTPVMTLNGEARYLSDFMQGQ